MISRLSSFEKHLHKKCNRHFRTALLAAILLLSTPITWAQDVFVGLASNGGPDGKGTAYSIKPDGTGFSIIKRFADWGANPINDLVRGTDGNLYGMTQNGGTYGYGTIFRMTPTGAITILKNLNLTVDGGYPKGSLIQGKDGIFYGMTSGGSLNNSGCIFKITSSGQYTIIRSLATNTDGGRPQGHLIQATDGNFYGINNVGGTHGYGTIFRLTTAGVYTVLKSLNGTTEGGSSYGSLVQANDGALYGMTKYGGTSKSGVIFRMTLAGVYSVIRHLNGTTDGWYPDGDLIQGRDGLLYGMTPGAGSNGNGTIFKITLSGTSFTLLEAMSAATFGGSPQGSLIQAADGNFYGMTSSMSGGFAGSLFKVTSDGTMTLLKKLASATDGGRPSGGLVQTPDGLLYGMTYEGGKSGKGTIFKSTTAGVLTVLVDLNGSAQGNVPQDNLALGKDSTYFGVTREGGTYNFGTIFKICAGVSTTLKSFNNNADGSFPEGGLVLAGDGNLYGTTTAGGTYSGGTIFRITPAGIFTVLRHLKGSTDGGSPYASMMVGADGALYGTTSTGGTSSGGTVFKITTAGVFSVIRHLVSATDGNASKSGLVAGTDGFLYGTTSSRFFKLKPDGTSFSVLHTFTGSEGSTPVGTLVRGSDGAFYGTNRVGGTYTHGTIFRLTSAGAITILRQLNGATDGSWPEGTLVQGADGAFYGTTTGGGTNKVGTIFKVTTASVFSVLRHLNMATDGGVPQGGLIKAPKNTLVANAQSVSTTEDVAKAIVLSGTGGATLTYNITTAPKNGTLSGSGANRTYTPVANFAGKDSFYFVTVVGCLFSTPAKVLITVTPVNDAPVLATIGNKTVTLGSTLSFAAAATDADAGQTKTFSLVTPPAGATINATTGLFSWKPAGTGTFTFKARVTDNGTPVLFDEEQITVTVTSTANIALVPPPSTEEKEEKSKDWKGKKPKVTLYPNPAIHKLIITGEDFNNQTSVTIVTISGSVVYRKDYGSSKRNNLEIAVDRLVPGHYLLQIKTAAGDETLKFIKL